MLPLMMAIWVLQSARLTEYRNEHPYLERLFISFYRVDVKKLKWYLEISCFVLSSPPYAWDRVLLQHQVFVLFTQVLHAYMNDYVYESSGTV